MYKKETKMLSDSINAYIKNQHFSHKQPCPINKASLFSGCLPEKAEKACWVSKVRPSFSSLKKSVKAALRCVIINKWQRLVKIHRHLDPS